jgi:uncharacterized protein
MKMNEFDFALDVKAIDSDGSIEGLAAGYGNLDYGGDVMLPGSAIIRSKSLPMLLYHDQKRPVGVWREFKETSDGLLVKGTFAMSTGEGRDAHAMTKDGALAGLSVGYKSIRDKIVGKSRHIAEAIIHEISLVTIPMNEKALIVNVKELLNDGALPSLPEFENFLREAGFSKTQATAVAGKGLSHLIRREAGSASDDAAEFYAALGALSPV